MFHYPFHVGDYIADTAHLSIEEDIAYRRLLDLYYTSEKPIPNDGKQVSRRIRMGEHEGLVCAVLEEFFKLHDDDCWHHSRCDDEIAKFQGFIEAGKRGAAKRWAKPSDSHPIEGAIGTENQEPRTENQEPISIDAKASKSKTSFPDCPHGQILELWKKHLPHLMQPRTWEGARQTALKNRWVQAAKPSEYSPKGYKTQAEGLDWWDSFFMYIANDTKLSTGFESQGRVWKPTLEWVCQASNFAKIIDGKYNK